MDGERKGREAGDSVEREKHLIEGTRLLRRRLGGGMGSQELIGRKKYFPFPTE